MHNPCWSWCCCFCFGEQQRTIPTPPPFGVRLELGSDLESGVCTAGKVNVNGGTSSQDEGSNSGVVKSGNDRECRTMVLLCGFLRSGCCCAEEVCRSFLRRKEGGILRMNWRLVGKDDEWTFLYSEYRCEGGNERYLLNCTQQHTAQAHFRWKSNNALSSAYHHS